ncbi:stalk domain-containing protein [Paenibacillus hodogayensis]|uniref:Stalk domain-containing protein n=1 Tax=Paenibacillus hodogayensis TaxID=279208 RepID=A0ABV5W1Y2_9BACL
MKKFLLGAVFGAALAGSAVVYAADAIQAYVFPAALVINGKAQQPENGYALLNVDGQAYVPLRFMADRMGGAVAYDEDKRTVYVISPGEMSGHIAVGQTKAEVMAWLGDRYQEIRTPDMGQEPAWRYDFGVNDSYKVSAVRQLIETWADPDGLRDGLIAWQLLVTWKEGKVDRYYMAYAGKTGNTVYDIGHEQLETIRSRLVAAREAIETEHGIRWMGENVRDNELVVTFRKRDDFERGLSAEELESLRRTIEKAAGLKKTLPVPLKLEPFPFSRKADITGVIIKKDEEAGRILVADPDTRLPNGRYDESVWLSMNKDGIIRRAADGSPLSLEALRAGERIRVWYDGEIVFLSDPPQTKALQISVLDAEPGS